MAVTKSCVYYRDSRCFLKDRICDLSCDPTGLYGQDDECRVGEEQDLRFRKEEFVWHERLLTVSEEEEEGDT